MAWKITFPDGTVVDFDDLPPEFFGKIAEPDKSASWYGVYLAPFGDDSERLYRVVKAAAEHAGIDPPAAPSSMREAKAMIEMFEMVPDIAEQPMMDGFPPGPDEVVTGSPSTSSGDTTGPGQSPEPNPSDGS